MPELRNLTKEQFNVWCSKQKFAAVFQESFSNMSGKDVAAMKKQDLYNLINNKIHSIIDSMYDELCKFDDVIKSNKIMVSSESYFKHDVSETGLLSQREMIKGLVKESNEVEAKKKEENNTKSFEAEKKKIMNEAEEKIRRNTIVFKEKINNIQKEFNEYKTKVDKKNEMQINLSDPNSKVPRDNNFWVQENGIHLFNVPWWEFASKNHRFILELGSVIGMVPIDLLMSIMDYCKLIHTLDNTLSDKLCKGTASLSKCEISEVQAYAISYSLYSNTTIKTLKLYNNSIADIGASSIAKALEVNTTITMLEFWKNQIGDYGAIAIGKSLTMNSSITKLMLNINQIGDIGAVSIGQGLKINSKLIKLFLNDNKIGDDGAVSIGEGLKINTSLEVLWLKNNQISDIGASSIGNALKSHNSVLKTLYINGNKIGQIGKAKLLEAKKNHQSLKALYIDGWKKS